MNPERLTFKNDTPFNIVLFCILTGLAKGGGDVPRPLPQMSTIGRARVAHYNKAYGECPNSTIRYPRLDVVVPAAMTFLGEGGLNKIG